MNLQPLRELAAEGRHAELATAIAVVRSRNAPLARRIEARIPALVINRDPRFDRTITSAHFYSWTQQNPAWAHSVESAVRRPHAFEGFIDAWLEELAEFERQRSAKPN